MASLFDPSAFIAAEKAEHSQTVADVCTPCEPRSNAAKSAEIRDPEAIEQERVATFATFAAPEDGGYPWSSGLKALTHASAPVGMDEFRWKRLIRIARLVSDEWGGDIMRLGWNPLEIFGCNPDPFARRVDRNGVVVSLFNMLSPLEIVEFTASAVVLADRHGNLLRHRPFGPRGQVYLWEAYLLKGGP